MARTKTKNADIGSTIAIVILSILLLASLTIGVALAYFTATSGPVIGDITLGNPVSISITQGGAAVETFTFSDTALPGSSYEQPIAVTAPANTTEALLRAKLTLTNTDTAASNVNATTTEDWVAGDDDYYYYKGSITAGGSVDFVTAITIPTSLTNADANKTFTVSVIVEAIQKANNAANAVWTTAPSTWLSTYSPTT